MDQHDGSPAGSTGAATPAAGGTHRAAAPGVEGPLPVVTLWEHFGSGADAIGREVAQRLSLPYHQQAFSSEEIESDGRDRGRSAERAGISHDRAAKRQKREDQVRVDMSKSLYGWDPSAVENDDMVLNTSRLSQDAAVEAIVHAATGPGAAR